MRRVFNLNGSCASAFIMGIVGGYPVGARAAITSYERGLCTKTECERMLSFCNNSGPAFILGVVGAGVFANSRAGMLLYLAHVLASLTVGVCFRFYKRREPVSRTRAVTYDTQKPSRVFVDSVRSGLAGIGNISAFVIFSPSPSTCSSPPARSGRLRTASRPCSRPSAWTAAAWNACSSVRSR